MTLDEFVKTYADQDINFPNCETNQCMTLMHLYLRDVLGIEDPLTLAQPHAAEVFTNFVNLVGHDKFDLIENTPEGIPQRGDIVVFGSHPEGIDGHICVFLDGDVNQFNSFDSNYPFGSKPHIQNHNYDHLLGWLRAKPVVEKVEEVAPVVDDEDHYKGLDLGNRDSVKAAIDAWHDVAHGVYYRADEHHAAIKAIADNAETAPDVDAINTKITELKNKPAAIPDDLSSVIPQEKKESHPHLFNLWNELTSFLKAPHL